MFESNAVFFGVKGIGKSTGRGARRLPAPPKLIIHTSSIIVEVIPRERSFVWLVDRTTGRLARTRLPRVNPVGVSASDMASRDSREARERWSTWSATLG